MHGEPGAAPDLGRERGQDQRVARARLEHVVEPQRGDARPVGVKARIAVEHVGQSSRGGPKIAAGEAEEGEGHLVQAGIRCVGVDLAELGGEREQQVRQRRAAAARGEAREASAVHFRPTLSGFIR